MRHSLIPVLAALFALIATAALPDDEEGRLDIGGDAYRGGQTVTFSGEGAQDIYLAGERVTAAAPASGSAYLAGRWVTASSPVGGDLFAFGQTVSVEAPVGGNATVAGQTVRIGEVGGDLRVAGSEVTLQGDVGGYALVGAEFVTVRGRIGGDLQVSARTLSFADNAEVAGILTVYEAEEGDIAIPERVAPPERVVRREIEEWDEAGPVFAPPSPRAIAIRWLSGVLVITLLAALIAAVIPDQLARFREALLARPVHAVWLGFLGLSAAIGAAIVTGMTVIGLLLAPAFILIAALLGFGGYVVGAYAFGVALLTWGGRELPDSFGDRALAAGLGALVAGILGLIPFLGWLFVLAVSLAGIGAVVATWVRPKFFAAA